MKSPTFFVLDRVTNQLLYQAKTLSQARGFVDASDTACIIAFSAEKYASEYNYQICLVDDSSGKVIAHGPIVDIGEGSEALDSLRVVLLPVLNQAKAEVMA